jgi:hypothetical protein
MPPPCRTSTCPSLGVGAGNPLTPFGEKIFPPGVCSGGGRLAVPLGTDLAPLGAGKGKRAALPDAGRREENRRLAWPLMRANAGRGAAPTPNHGARLSPLPL